MSRDTTCRFVQFFGTFVLPWCRIVPFFGTIWQVAWEGEVDRGLLRPGTRSTQAPSTTSRYSSGNTFETFDTR